MNKKEYLLKVLGAIFIVVFLISMAACLFLIFPIEIDESYQGILAIYMFVVLVVFGIVFGLTEYEGLQGIGRMLLVSAVLLMVMVGCCKYLDVIPSDLEEYGVYTFTASSGERDILGEVPDRIRDKTNIMLSMMQSLKMEYRYPLWKKC